jgi:hypothetical protein
MLSFGALSFAVPWLLVALASLPALWWLLRAVPPAPSRIVFPAIRLLFGLPQSEETPHRTPWWLLALRLLLAALVILALAHPVLDPGRLLRGSGPLVLVIDNDWSAGNNWELRREAALALIDEADRENRTVYIAISTPAEVAAPAPLRPLSAAEARDRIRGLAPQAWSGNHGAILAQVEMLDLPGSANAVWLTSGLAEPADSARNSPSQFLESALQRLGSLRIIGPAPDAMPVYLSESENTAEGLRLQVSRVTTGPEQPVALVTSDDAGRLLARETVTFPTDALTTEATITIPSEVRNRIARVVVEGTTTAGATMLFDESSRRRPVGLASGDIAQVDQPLLGNAFYINRALEPFADIRTGTISELLERQLAVLFLSDIGNLTETEINSLNRWIAAGGVLVRFAGPNLAEGSDALLPVALRRGGRVFGGVMSWERPATLAPFDDTSPFAGLATSDEIVVQRQVLAQPAPDLAGKTWARLNDGTPLVTGEKRGEGWLVLYHTTANAEWSSLALSGTYVGMLRRLVALSQGVSTDTTSRPLPPLASLDGFGRLGDARVTARPLPAGDLTGITPGPSAPPGFYGTPESRIAFNFGPTLSPVAFRSVAPGVELANYGPSQQTDLRVWLLIVAFALLLLDFVISLALRGHLPGRRMATAVKLVAAIFGTGLLVTPQTGHAQSSDRFALEATEQTHLAYVLTGDTKIDETSRSGLFGLGQILSRRTSIEPGSPIGLDIERDELAFFPLIYWPMTDGQNTLSDGAKVRVNQFLRNGGTIIFDTRDQSLSGIGGVGPGTQTLRGLVEGLDIPALIEVPQDHVLTKAFYLLQDFPGRWVGGQVWVQQPDERVNDGVSSVIIGSNDYAAAWAIDVNGRPMFPLVTGSTRQRELAFRFGVNLVMYALTGNYKADQVHVDEILERLGQ